MTIVTYHMTVFLYIFIFEIDNALEGVGWVDREMETNQYNVRKFLGFLALVALPMAFFRFVLLPILVPIVPFHPGILYWILMIVGMIWQFVLSVIILKRELGDISWEKLKKRLWMNHPIHSKTLPRSSPFRSMS